LALKLADIANTSKKNTDTPTTDSRDTQKLTKVTVQEQTIKASNKQLKKYL
jgi:hypothetical protein